MGKNGIAEVASQCFDKAHYAADRIGKIKGFELAFPNAPFFKEFTVRTSRDVNKVMDSCRQRGILAGVPLSRFARDKDCFLVAVTEKRTKDEIDQLANALENA
jgi:glycine dehydrogenase subunit 1